MIPILVTLLIFFCDYALIILHQEPYSISSKVAIGLYNVGVVMAIWSLFATTLSDPGFLPKGYRYDTTMMTRLVR